MKTIKIKDKEYPFKLTLRALKDYEDKHNKSISDASGMTVEQMVDLIYNGCKAGAKAEGKEFELILDFIFDECEMSDMEKAISKAFDDPK